MTRVLLIDGDIVAYRHAAAGEQAIQWDESISTLHTDLPAMRGRIDAMINGWVEALEADEYRVALTGSENFRKDILPEYKAQRKSNRKPIGLGPGKEYLVEGHGAVYKDRLEADDILGIWATSSTALPGEKIIVSIDKDLASIPGLLFNPEAAKARIADVKDAAKTEVDCIATITHEAADRMHMWQTLTGDTVDNYKGCPGVGPKGADKLLNAAMSPECSGGVVDEGVWSHVLGAFKKAGLTEDDALVQARVARILRREDYDFTNKEPILWKPPTSLS